MRVPDLRLKSLRGTAFGLIAVIVVALAASGGLRYFAALRSVDHQIDLRLRDEAADLIDNDPAIPTDLLAQRIRDREAVRASYALGYMLLDASGRRVAGRASIVRPPIGFSDVDAQDRLEGLVGVDRGRALATPLSGGRMLVVLADSDPTDSVGSSVANIMALGFLASSIFAIAGIGWMASVVQRRMTEISDTAEAIIDGDLQRRIAVEGRTDAFDREAIAFNRMLDRISELMTNLAQVSTSIAHDLRTPLARLRTKLVSLNDRTQDSATRSGLEEALRQCDDILAQFTAILRLAEIEGGARRARFGSVRLDAVIGTAIESLRPAAEQSGHLLSADLAEDASITGDSSLLAQMLINGIENALRHTPHGSTVAVSLERRTGEAVIAITDNGPGIAATDQPLALRRFGRLEPSRSTPGHGLGLPMIVAIASLHSGKVFLGDANPGLRLEISLPISPSA